MEEYNRLPSEDEKRLFLRNEMKRHNIQLADAAKGAGVIEPLDYSIFQNHGYMGLYGGLDAKGIHKNKGLKKSQRHACKSLSSKASNPLFLMVKRPGIPVEFPGGSVLPLPILCHRECSLRSRRP